MIKIRRLQQRSYLLAGLVVRHTAKPAESTTFCEQHIQYYAQQRSLSTAIGPQYTKDTAFRHIKRYAFQRSYRAI